MKKKGTRIVLHLTTGQWNMNRSGIFLPANELRSRVKILQGARCKVQGEQLQGEKYARCKVQGAGARSFFSHPARTADIDLRVKIKDLLQVNLSSFVAVGETKKIKYKNIQRSRIDPIKKYMYI